MDVGPIGNDLRINSVDFIPIFPCGCFSEQGISVIMGSFLISHAQYTIVGGYFFLKPQLRNKSISRTCLLFRWCIFGEIPFFFKKKKVKINPNLYFVCNNLPMKAIEILLLLGMNCCSLCTDHPLASYALPSPPIKKLNGMSVFCCCCHIF